MLPNNKKVNLVKNPSYESDDWETIEGTSQQPENWKVHTYRKDEALRFPTKMQGGVEVPALSSGNAGEYVHKGIVPDEKGNPKQNLPQIEMTGQKRALVLDGVRTFKVFSGGVPDWFACDLYQDVNLIFGKSVTAIVPICAETGDTPTQDKLEDDHFRVAVSLIELPEIDGQSLHYVSTRRYVDMIKTFDVRLPDGSLCERPWNLFTLKAPVPASGKFRLNLYFQQNWPRHNHGCDFFIDNVQMFYDDEPSQPSPEEEFQKEREQILRQLSDANNKLQTAKLGIDNLILLANNLKRSL